MTTYIELHYIGKRTISSDPSIFKDLDHLLDQVAFEFKIDPTKASWTDLDDTSKLMKLQARFKLVKQLYPDLTVSEKAQQVLQLPVEQLSARNRFSPSLQFITTSVSDSQEPVLDNSVIPALEATTQFDALNESSKVNNNIIDTSYNTSDVNLELISQLPMAIQNQWAYDMQQHYAQNGTFLSPLDALKQKAQTSSVQNFLCALTQHLLAHDTSFFDTLPFLQQSTSIVLADPIEHDSLFPGLPPMILLRELIFKTLIEQLWIIFVFHTFVLLALSRVKKRYPPSSLDLPFNSPLREPPVLPPCR